MKQLLLLASNIVFLTSATLLKGRLLGYQGVPIGNQEIKVQGHLENLYHKVHGYNDLTAKSNIDGLYELEVPNDLNHLALEVISRVNHYKPLQVKFEKDQSIVDLPDWKMSELSLCGYIMMYDDELNLNLLKPGNDPFDEHRYIYI